MREFTVVTAHEKLATHYAHRVFLSSGFWVDIGEFLLMVTETTKRMATRRTSTRICQLSGTANATDEALLKQQKEND